MKKKLCITLFCYTASLLALPTGGDVMKGDANITTSSDSVQIQANGKAIVEWNQFDLAKHETAHFVQSQTKSAILNRVTGGKVSEILGSLQANCPIYLINPDGVYIGTTAKIETAGFLATTADISNEMFWSEDPLLFDRFGPGKIVHLGTISSQQGDVFFIARTIENAGQIDAPGRAIQMVTHEIMLNPATKQTVFIRPGTAEEIKTLEAPYEMAIQQTKGAEALEVHNQNGRIYLVAGSLRAQAGTISASSQTVHVSEAAVLDVSSTDERQGGHIALVADEALTFHGFAKVGSAQGDGGTLHLSCNGSSFNLGENFIDASAPHGKVGHVIFDPQYVMIIPSGSAPATGNTFASNPSGTVNISGATLQSALNSANVTIQANTDIVFVDNVTATSTGNGLTLQAGRSIIFDGNLTLNQGDFTASINDSGAISANRDPGVAVFRLFGLSTILTQGGDFSIDVGTFGATQVGEVSLQSGIVNAGGGNISIQGFARRDGSDYVNGLYAGGSCLIQTAGSGLISLTGTGGTGSAMNPGIYLSSPSVQIQADAGNVNIVGFGGGDGTGDGNTGIYSAADCQTLSTGSILFEGTAGNGVNSNTGVYLNSGTATTQDGNITINGTGLGTGNLNFGVQLNSIAQCISNGAGVVMLTGTSGTGQNNNHGVILSNGTLSANTGSISITGTGQGLANSNYGIRLEANSQCISTGTAPISMQGNNLAGQAMNAGISISTLVPAVTSGYGNIQLQGISDATSDFNQGIRIERGTISSTGTGAGSAQIQLIGTGGPGTDQCNGVIVIGRSSVVTSIDGNITIEGTARGSGIGNQPIFVNPPTQVYTTGSGTITYIPH